MKCKLCGAKFEIIRSDQSICSECTYRFIAPEKFIREIPDLYKDAFLDEFPVLKNRLLYFFALHQGGESSLVIEQIPSNLNPNVMHDVVKIVKPKRGSLEARKKNFLIIIGEVGVGKTRLLYAYSKHCFLKNCAVKFYSADKLFGEFNDLIFDSKGFNYLCEMLSQISGFIIIDDLGSENKRNPETLSKFEALIDQMSEHLTPCIITSNLPLEQIASIYGARIYSRMIASSTPIILRGRDRRAISQPYAD